MQAKMMKPLRSRSGTHRAMQKAFSSAIQRPQNQLRRQTQASAASPTITAPSVQQLERLCAWCKSNGVALDKLTTSTSIDTGNGILVAAKDISAGETIVTIADGQWLSPAAVRKSSIGKAVEGLEPWVQISLFIMSMSAAPSSDLAPYLATFPAKPNTPLFWSDSQLSLLQGTQVMDSLLGYRAFFEAKYQELFGPQGVLAGQPGIFPPEVFTYDNFAAAVATVRSRSHAPLEEGALSLVPLADMVSHKRDGNTMWKVKSAGLFGKGQVLAVEATRPIRKGEELTMDYAPGKLDSTVLLDYGVIDAQNTRPGYALSLGIGPSDRLYDDKLDVVENNPGLAPSMTFNITPGYTPSELMMGMLRLINLKGADVFLLEPVFSNQVWGFMCEPISEDNERDVCNNISQGARAALSRYATSIDADLALLKSGDLVKGSREEIAVKVRLGEMESLDAMQQWFDTRAATLKRLVYYQERRLRSLGLIDDDGRTTYDGFFKDGIA